MTFAREPKQPSERAALRQSRGPSSQSPSLRAQLIGLQGSAGNRAVTDLLSVQRCGPVPPDQCPCHSTDAGDDDHRTAEPRSVQRLGLSDVTGAVKSVAGNGLAAVFGDAKATVDAAERTARAGGETGERDTTARLEQRAGQLDGELKTLDATSRQSAEEQAGGGRQRAETVAAGTGTLEQQASQAEAGLAAASPMLGDLLSPATAVVEPARVETAGAVLDQASQAATGGQGGAVVGDSANAAKGLLGAGGTAWDCDLSEVLSGAGKTDLSAVVAAVNPGQRKSGAERLSAISGFAENLRQNVTTVGSRLRGALSTVAGSAGGRFRSLGSGLLSGARSAGTWLDERFGGLRGQVNGSAARSQGGHLSAISGITDSATAFLQGIAGRAGSAISGAAASLSKLLGSIGKAVGLPAGVAGFAQSLPAKAAETKSSLNVVSASLAARTRTLRDKVLATIKGAVNSVLQHLAAAHQRARALVEKAENAAKSAVAKAGKAIGSWHGGVLKRIAGKVGDTIRGITQSAGKLVGKVRDGTCAVMEKTAGQCVTQHLPDLGGGVNNSVRLIARGDLILPLEEFGVPGNLKVGAGAMVEVSAKDGLYTLKVEGTADLLFNETMGSDKHLEVGTPGASNSNLAQAWRALAPGAGPAGGAGASVSGAATGVAEAAKGVASDGLGGGRTAEVNAGLRGTSVSEWRFNAVDAKTSCDGVGGLVALLSMMGLAGVLPAPFNAAAGAAVYSGFADQLQYSRFSAGVGAEVKADLKTEGLAKFSGRLGADISENVETTRDPVTNQLVTSRTRTITGELDAAARAKLTAGALGAFNAFLTGEGIVRLTLAYQGEPQEAIVPTAVGGAIKVGIGLTDIDTTKLMNAIKPFLPDATGPIESAIRGGLPGMDGPREISLSLTVGRTYTGLEKVFEALAAYFNGPPKDVNVDGVIAIVKEHLDTIQPVDLVKLELSLIQRKRIDVGGVEGEGAAAGVDVDVSAEHEISKAWQNFAGHEPVMEAAAAKAKPVTTVVQPGKKKPPPPPPPGSHRAPTGRVDDPIQMTWYKPRSAYARVYLGEPGKKTEYKKDQFRRVPPPDNDIIGVAGFPNVGDPIQRERPTERSGKREREFVELLADHDFDWRGWSPDHVLDLAWGGDDEFHNLWPLRSDVNSNAGLMHSSRQFVEYNRPTDDPEQEPRRAPLNHPDFQPGMAAGLDGYKNGTVTFRINEITIH
jgi:hypothetical protein